MDNFDKSDIITDVAFNKNKAKFLPRNEQVLINMQLKQKLLRFVDEIKAVENRPVTMSLFDSMMNDMHGQRVKDLYSYRRDGNHIVALLCSSTPPELIYTIDNHLPVSVCMGAGEVERYTDNHTKGMCPLTRSMIGFLSTGMCVFFNLSDYVLASDYCQNIKKASTIIQEISGDLDVFCIESNITDDNEISINYSGLQEWIGKISQGKGLNKERFVEYCKLYSKIREAYKSIATLRKVQNPPIDGKNCLWIQQLFPVEEPKKLLSALEELIEELKINIDNNVGCNKDGSKKRVMLITPRIMPPFTEVFRLIENNNAIIVYEEMDMGITNINYNIGKLMGIIDQDNSFLEKSVRYIMESVDKTVSSCFNDFDINSVINKIEEYHVDAVINYSFKNCPGMEYKTNQINELLGKQGIRSMILLSDYLEMYENEDLYIKQINDFLDF